MIFELLYNDREIASLGASPTFPYSQESVSNLNLEEEEPVASAQLTQS